jgi:hypothetical protein
MPNPKGGSMQRFDMELTVIIIRAILDVAGEFCYKAMIIVVALYFANKWGII